MNISVVLTALGPNRPGLVNRLSQTAAAFAANWLESRMANFAGQFAGIVHLKVPAANLDALIEAFEGFDSTELRILITRGSGAPLDSGGHLVRLELVGQDHPGIVREISKVLALHGVSIEDLSTGCVSGAFSGGELFRARAQLRVPDRVATAQLRDALEALAQDLMVDVTLDESGAC